MGPVFSPVRHNTELRFLTNQREQVYKDTASGRRYSAVPCFRPCNTKAAAVIYSEDTAHGSACRILLTSRRKRSRSRGPTFSLAGCVHCAHGAAHENARPEG